MARNAAARPGCIAVLWERFRRSVPGMGIRLRKVRVCLAAGVGTGRVRGEGADHRGPLPCLPAREEGAFLLLLLWCGRRRPGYDGPGHQGTPAGAGQEGFLPGAGRCVRNLPAEVELWRQHEEGGLAILGMPVPPWFQRAIPGIRTTIHPVHNRRSTQGPRRAPVVVVRSVVSRYHFCMRSGQPCRGAIPETCCQSHTNRKRA